MPLSNGITRKIISGGEELVTKIVGNQKCMQRYGANGDLLKTTLTKIENYIFNTGSPRRKIGFIQESAKPVKNATKEVKTVIRNIFDSTKDRSVASIVDDLLVDGEKVGERVIVRAVDSTNPMEAMTDLRGGTYKKILRYFKGGKLEKESITVMENGKRTSRTVRNIAEEKKLSDELRQLEAELNRCHSTYNKRISALEKQLHELQRDKQLTRLTKSIEKDTDKLDYLEDIVDAISYPAPNRTVYHYNPAKGINSPVTAEEMQIPIEKLKAQISKLKQRLSDKKHQCTVLEEQLGISDIQIKMQEVYACETPEAKKIYELKGKINNLKQQYQQKTQTISFNGTYLAEKVGDTTFSLMV